MISRTLVLVAILFGLATSLFAQEPAEFENPADYPLMGDWSGRMTNPKGWPDTPHPQLSAQILPTNAGEYKVVLVKDLYRRAKPLAEFIVQSDGKKIVIDQQGWTVTFKPGEPAKGQVKRGNHLTDFVLEQAEWAPPSLGAKPPEGAKALLDGETLDDWEHAKGRAATWTVTDGVMETVGQSWNKGQNGKQGLGGDIFSKHTFGSLQYHMEFRYPVEEGTLGQGRGNSGLFFLPLPELQILNSYTTIGYYDEAGSMYRHLPAKVNAAGPPLVWQTYDVNIQFTGNGTAIVTAHLNGHRVHHEVEVKTDATDVGLKLQDHGNRLQWRNIWVKEL